MNAHERLNQPDAQKLIADLKEMLAPDATRMQPADILQARAILDKDETANKILQAFETLGIVPEKLERATAYETMAKQLTQQNTQEQPTHIQEQTLLPTRSADTQSEPKPDSNHGGKRQGAGRKPEEGKTKTKACPITLYPDDWKKLDALAERLQIKRPEVIRRAMDALIRELDTNN